MAIAFDNVSSVQDDGGLSGFTIPAFTVAGVDRFIFVGVGSTPSGRTVNSVVRNATASENFTEKWDAVANVGGVDTSCAGFYFVNPEAGSFSITVTLSGATDEGCAGAISLTGVDQATPTGTHGTNSGETTTATATVTAGNDDWLVDFVYTLRTTITAGADQTMRWEQENIGANVSGGSSTQLGSANDIMTWALGAGGFADAWHIGAVPIKPVVAPVGVPVAWFRA